jgi:cytochrome P460
LLSSLAVQASPTCPDEQATPQVAPKDPEFCRKLEPFVKHPSEFPLNMYETKLNEYLTALCHRDEQNGWKVDKRIRDTGPWVGTYRDGKWTGQYYGTHAPVLIWYSPDFYAWLKANRPQEGAAPAAAQPVPDGAIMVKEMYTAPAAACAGIDPTFLLPRKGGSAVMVRDSKGAHDGWFWGWYGWKGSGWAVDWPASSTSPYPNMGFGQYCTNCHASAVDNQTFASLNNIKGEPGHPLVFLSQNFFLDPSWQSLQTRIIQSADVTTAAAGTPPSYDPAFTKTFPWPGGSPQRGDIVFMPPATYDNVWVKPGAPTPASQYVTSDQCIGCHDAGGTGLQFDMTQPADTKLLNISPYGSWRGSPMGLAGRDPVFFAQLASETETFHRDSAPLVQDTCLGCHGILGQRQFGIDTREKTGTCAPFLRPTVSAVPYPPNDPVAQLAHFGALARDGISCATCHHMVLGDKDSARYGNDPQNKCVAERQALLNPGLSGFAKTFTGSFFVGPPDRLYGPFQEPKIKPMKNALGIEPAHSQTITSSELCGSCHTVHLPVLHRGQTIGHTYEQTTYPEWAFSDFRTGDSPDGDLPYGSGPRAQSCQDCHMPNKDAAGNPYRSKIAAIQEYTSFPQAEHTLPPEDIDLPVRSGFGKHTLVGLNVFLLRMAAQFPDVLGILPTDPMLTTKGIDSIPAAEAAMVDQAVNRTAAVTIGDVKNDGTTLSARVTVINRVGHKFPSGVGFRRAFLEFDVLDVANRKLWSSGRTNGSGVIVDDKDVPIAGELWWKDDCSARIDPNARIHQPHYKEIARQDQAQIYQELVSTPPDGPAPQCGIGAPPAGQLTTSFLSICSKVKDNRLLPSGFLSLEERKKISLKLGANEDMALDTDPVGVGDDPDYRTGGSDSLVYRIPLDALKGNGKPAAIQATLHYQATPPFFLQDRFCTSKSPDTQRLYYVAGNLNLAGTPAQDWKLRVVTSGPVSVP